MKSILLPRIPLASLAAILALGSIPASAKDLYVGRISLTGEMQNDAKPGSISFTFKGQVNSTTSRDVANVSGGGLFRSNTDAIVNTTFTGKLKTYARLPIRPGGGGQLVRSNKTVTVRVRGRVVTFPGGKVTLKRPINATRLTPQKIRGTGSYRVRL